jgi:uncharacterized protein YjbJ (UPF0337 family)
MTTPSSNENGNANWSDQKTKLKAKFPELTDADLTFENGKKDDMFGKIEKKLGKSKQELHDIIGKL